MNNPTGRPRLPPNVRLEASDDVQLNFTNEEYLELNAALSISISHYQGIIDVSMSLSTAEDKQAVLRMRKRVETWQSLLIKVSMQRRKLSQE